MALPVQQIPKWFYSMKINFINITQIRSQFMRPRKTILHGLLALPQQSSGNFFHWGFKNYRTFSLWNSSQAPSSTREENIDAQDSHPLSLNGRQLKTEVTDFDSQISLEELEDLPPISPLQQISEEDAVQIVAEPPLPPISFTLQDYVDRSETLQKLVLLGVNLSKLEKRRGAGTLLLKLDFKNDIQKILMFLKDVGVEDNQLGAFLTENYIILTEDLDNLKTRVAYLESKNFSKTDISRMIVKAPYLLSFSVDRLDNRLGFFQKELGLNVEKTRNLVIRLPRLLTGSLEPVKENMKVYQLQLGFKHNEIQHMVTRIPKILTASKKKLTETFDYVHNVMNIPHHIIVKFPQVFNSKVLKIKERHSFLNYLGRAQYDPQKPNYISLDKLVSLPDEVFCKEIAKASLEDFEMFLKTV
ncbi:transcription termination factor 3, mitochondrial [Antechinus flavipes]|uniref:transcription termination factor 3, mitochondrial n=1 Tax=Antechinus flavipes TaxID=38775 RepID=UPI0022363F80|nr:transcription termination factor 3, mitochondrial [Antechinus flavipes]